MELKCLLHLLHYFAAIVVALILRNDHFDRESSAAGTATVLKLHRETYTELVFDAPIVGLLFTTDFWGQRCIGDKG
jgi:hypothetical protein